MDENTLNNKLASLDKRIKELEAKSRAYQNEKDDSSARDDMAEDGKIDNTDNISLEIAKQIITSFNQSYDEQSIKDIEDLRTREGSDNKRVQKYDKKKKLVEQLKERYNIQ